MEDKDINFDIFRIAGELINSNIEYLYMEWRYPKEVIDEIYYQNILYQ
jgi:hypothetical protein